MKSFASPCLPAPPREEEAEEAEEEKEEGHEKKEEKEEDDEEEKEGALLGPAPRIPTGRSPLHPLSSGGRLASHPCSLLSPPVRTK